MNDTLGERYRDAMRRFTSTVTVITTGQNAERHGMTATAVSSVSLDPPSLLVCVNRRGRLHTMMENCERFCVNVLHSQQVAVARAFAEPDHAERFASGGWDARDDGIPFLRDAQAVIVCAKALAAAHGSHTIFIGNVEDIITRDDISPLLYQNGAYGVFERMLQADQSLLAELTGWG